VRLAERSQEAAVENQQNIRLSDMVRKTELFAIEISQLKIRSRGVESYLRHNFLSILIEYLMVYTIPNVMHPKARKSRVHLAGKSRVSRREEISPHLRISSRKWRDQGGLNHYESQISKFPKAGSGKCLPECLSS